MFHSQSQIGLRNTRFIGPFQKVKPQMNTDENAGGTPAVQQFHIPIVSPTIRKVFKKSLGFSPG